MLALVSLLAALTAFGGTKDGGGGGAFVCSSAEHATFYSLMADLWETENTPFRWPHKVGTLPIPYNDNLPAETQFRTALAKLAKIDASFAARVLEVRDEIFARKRSLPENMEIIVPDDLKIGYKPRGCELMGIMYYNGESDQLDVREDLFAILRTQTDIAAAWMHEAIYKVLRDDANHETSKYARRLVGCLFSTEENCLTAQLQPVPQDRVVWECASKNFSLKVYPETPVTDPKELLSGVHFLSADIFHLDDLGLGYVPQIPLKMKGGSEAFQLSTWTMGGLQAYRLALRVDLLGFRFNGVSGNLEGFEVSGYRHFYATDPFEAGYRFVHEAVTCRRSN